LVTLTGFVTNGGSGIPGATVSIVELQLVTETDSQGRYTFSNIPRSTYTVYAAKFGYAPAQQSGSTSQILAGGQRVEMRWPDAVTRAPEIILHPRTPTNYVLVTHVNPPRGTALTPQQEVEVSVELEYSVIDPSARSLEASLYW